jgi:uncharacterized protein (DUF39 family)
MPKTIQEINQRIRKGKAVVLTAEEIVDFAKQKGAKRAAQEVDVVTTGTFAPMCSSGAYLNIGHTKPRIKLGGGQVTLNAVPVYTGFAAVDVMLGATAIPDDDPRNQVYPGEFRYGGGHVIHDLLSGKAVTLEARAYGTDCYPKKRLEIAIRLDEMNEAVLFNPRNAYQNYNVAVNLSDKVIYTYMGTLRPQCGNANYCSAGQLSPLMNDPLYRSIGVGTRIFLGGGVGYVIWHGTQHNPGVPRTEGGVPKAGAGTLAVMGDLKQMSADWLRGISFIGYGASLAVGIGVPIPILNEEVLEYTRVTDADIWAPIVDYSETYPNRSPDTLGSVTYGQLRTGKIQLNGKEVATASLSSYARARTIATTLKEWIQSGSFLLSDPVAGIPGADSGYAFKPCKETPVS